MKKLALICALGLNAVFAAPGDTINIDNTNTTLNGSALRTGLQTDAPSTWTLASRECCEVGSNVQDDAVSTKGTETIQISIPTQPDLAMYELRLYGKGKFYDLSYTISVDDGADSSITVPALNGSGHTDTVAYYASSFISGDAHTISITNTSPSSQWFELDYFVVAEIPDLADLFKDKKPGDSVQIITPGDTVYTPGTTEPNIIPPETTTVVIGGDSESTPDEKTPIVILGDTIYVEIPVVTSTIEGILNLHSDESVVKVYNLSGKLVSTMPRSLDWKQGLAEGMYITISGANKNLEIVQ